MKRTNFQSLKKLLISLSHEFTVSTTFYEIEEFILNEAINGRYSYEKYSDDYDEEKCTGTHEYEVTIELNQFHTRSRNPETFTVTIVEGFQDRDIDILEIRY